MTRRILIAVLVLYSCANAAVRFEGNHHFRSAVLMELCTQPGDVDQHLKSISAAYAADGYFLGQVSAKITAADTLFSITEGKRFTCSELRLIGLADSTAARLLQELPHSAPLTKSSLEQLTKELTRLYANNGYPFAQAEIKNLDISDAIIIAHMLVVEGPLVTVGNVDFPGIRTTKPEPLRKRLALHSGDLFRETDLESSERTLGHLRHCKPSGKASLTYESLNRTVNVALPLRDERNLAFDGLAYLNPDNTIAGQVSVNLINAFGRGEEFGFIWSRQNQLSRKLNLNALLPYFDDYPLDLRATLSQEARDSSFNSTSATAGASCHLSENWSLGSAIRWNKITPQENQTSPSARLLAVDLNVQYDRRNDIHRTTRGAFVTQQVTSAYRKSFESGSVSNNGYSSNLNTDAKIWLPLRHNLILFQRAQYFQITSDFAAIPIDQLIPVGGVETVRGYRENSYLARLGFIGSTELQWYAAGNLMLHLFSDNAYIKSKSKDGPLAGFGVGMIVMTSAGSFRFDISMGEEKKLGRMLVHLGLEGKL